jgi:hypothetical protein
LQTRSELTVEATDDGAPTDARPTWFEVVRRA